MRGRFLLLTALAANKLLPLLLPCDNGIRLRYHCCDGLRSDGSVGPAGELARQVPGEDVAGTVSVVQCLRHIARISDGPAHLAGERRPAILSLVDS